MRSLYVGILLVMVGILSLSFIAFRSISNRMEKIHIDPVFDAADQLQLDSARTALQNGGGAAVTAYMQELNRLFGGSHYLLDGRGIDVVSGVNRAALLPRPFSEKSRSEVHGRVTVTHRSADGRYWFVAVAPPLGRPEPWTFFPYYLLVIGVTGLLCWLAAVGVVSPVRSVAAAVASFGQGDLAARVEARRRDEIGELGRAFNGMADRLERLITSERRLLEDISHELRSPLTRLKFAVKLARTSPDPLTALDRVERDVDRMTSLVSDIVAITGLEGDPSARSTATVHLGRLVDEVVADCRIEAEAFGCGIEVQGKIDSAICGNSELLRRAIENVVRNAIRYSSAQAPVRIALQQTRDAVQVAVRDSGPGVPDDALARIFDPFFRVEEARDKTSGGSGLGLSIAKRAVQLHGGTIKAENAMPGLCVTISIPLAPQVEGC